MNILIYSPAFPPQIGGLEEMARICAEGFAVAGHEVTVVCSTENIPQVEFPFRVLRKAGWRTVNEAASRCDVFLMFNMSLKGLPHVLANRKPLVISHQGWYGRSPEDLNWRARLKRFLSCKLATNIGCSRSVSDYMGCQCYTIPNTYNDVQFRLRPEVPRVRDFLFVGRLVSDKGADVFVNALAVLASEGISFSATITGSGPEEPKLRQQVERLKLEKWVVFTGALRGDELARCMNAHRVLVVPSTWAEPFGIVALEAIASGCVAVVSAKGGLPEAIGPCGMTFANGDVGELAKILHQIYEGNLREWTDPFKVRKHLEDHQASQIARDYLEIIQRSSESQWCEVDSPDKPFRK